jgi:CrcB protein
MNKFVCIAVGGAIGSLLRYLLSGWVQQSVQATAAAARPPLFPWGTLTVNVLGCLVLGALAAAFTGPLLIREEYRVGLTIGILGGLTTFSTFELETFYLVDDKQFPLALANVGASVGLGFLAVWAGYRLVQWWLGL